MVKLMTVRTIHGPDTTFNPDHIVRLSSYTKEPDFSAAFLVTVIHLVDGSEIHVAGSEEKIARLIHEASD